MTLIGTPTPPNASNINYHAYDAKYTPLVDVFRQNFIDGLETAGSSFAVFKDGHPCIFLWGGMADRESERRWEEDTRTILFSTTKCISAIVLAYVLQINNISYEEKLVKFWPEYGKHGKENTTILHVTLHQAGLPYGDRPLNYEDLRDHKVLSKWFEDATPLWTPGTQSGYHALTIGLLMDQIIRRVDTRSRGLVEILDEDILKPNRIANLSIGLRAETDNEMVATLWGPSNDDIEAAKVTEPEAYRRYHLGDNLYNDRLNQIFPFLNPTAEHYNSWKNRLLPMPSNMGISSAFDFGRFLSLIATGKLLNEKTLALLRKPVLLDAMDVINGYPESKGYGFQFTKNPKGDWNFGHSGLGGQNVQVDMRRGLVYVYLCNGMKVADADLVLPYHRLVNKLYDILDH